MHSFPHGGRVRALAEAAGRAPEDILDFSANMNPIGPPEWLRVEIGAAVSSLVHYPDPDCAGLVQAASERYGLPTARFAAGNGSSELLFALPRVCGLTRAALFGPGYVDYEAACRRAGMDVAVHDLSPERDFVPNAADFDALLAGPAPALVIIGSPNNPNGSAVPARLLSAAARRRPDCLFLVDEAFADFDPDFESLTRDMPDNATVLLSLTKAFAVPGLRLGLMAGSEELCARVREEIGPWTVNALAQAVGARALADAAYLERTRMETPRLRAALEQGLRNIPGLTVFPSKANYLLCRLSKGTAADLGATLLKDHGLAIRDCANYRGLDARYFRVAVRPEAENARLLAALSAVLAPGKKIFAPPKKKTPAIMFQGTSSNAGKSLLAAAMCRILFEDGLRVAPFKSQNMSLNSFVTRDGGEMGRAQVLQAQACRLDPDVRMNPILLKPSSDVGSQVIVMGKPVGNMRVMEYVRYKPAAFAAARAAYDELAAASDVMVIEGAGSPAEVNLKAHDIVNMAMADYAGAIVLLVSDIDRGGSFASLLGTMDCLSEAERARTAGYVLNRFRGDPSLLAEALAFMRRATGKEVLGVVPNIDGHGLPEEDSVSFKAAFGRADKPGAVLDIAVLDLPHISNFTDFDALAVEPDAAVRVVRRAEDLGTPDAVILPGSKNTVADLEDLRRRGLDAALERLAASGGTEIAGVCAGLQMLGLSVGDPHGLETDKGGTAGLGLLPIATELAPEKTLLRSEAAHAPTGCAVQGYEIHHGVTEIKGECEIAVVRKDGAAIGFAARGGLVWGSYLHGVFDADGFRRVWLDGLRARKGLPPAAMTTAYDLEPALDRLAAVVRQSLDMKKIRALLGL